MRVTIVTDSHWSVTVGKSYDVLEVDILLGQASDLQVMFRVIGDGGDVQYISSSIIGMIPGFSTEHAIFPMAAFLDIPPGWMLEVRESLCSLGPREINKPAYRGVCSFWEDFYDSVGDARRVLAILLRERYPESYKRFRLRYGDAEGEPGR
jgi:hypothetical protein